MDRRRRHGSWIAGKKKNEARKSKRERDSNTYLTLVFSFILDPCSFDPQVMNTISTISHHGISWIPGNGTIESCNRQHKKYVNEERKKGEKEEHERMVIKLEGSEVEGNK